ncbi:hypothetical protein [Litoreibacter albidus]|uniref:hypothetical protein n=1 Tax=Litoreibacter albidus TaxID=670155 RepID=UPI001FCD9B9B|nr:hypothetical protein [Litoreibacter albidus]
MTHTIDWEAQIEEIRQKAAAAARHSERTVGGLSQALMETAAQSKTLARINMEQQQTNSRLGTLERALKSNTARLEAQPSKETRDLPTRLLTGLTGLLLGGLISGVYFWN